MELGFADFTEGSPKLGALKGLLAESVVAKAGEAPAPIAETHVLRRRSVEDLNADFVWCHQHIYKKDNLSQSAAFIEFVKLVFLKLLSDREVHAQHPEFAEQVEIEVPRDEVRFSTAWIEQREGDHPNPTDALQFQTLLRQLEADIQAGKRKRIFDADDHLRLSAETIKGVVARLEHVDLFGIDADLNGRLFETFLNATMRGKDLGQYFTPRSVVKLAIGLADLRVGRDHVDTVIDACCGSGGFLIDALADEWGKADANASFTDAESRSLKRLIATERVYGVDVAADPPLARIARMNMYLHGDGGSSVFQCDVLDKKVAELSTDNPETAREKDQLRDLIGSSGFADVALTNPPFAKEYQRKYRRDAAILDEYAVAFDASGGKRKPRPVLKSSVMFLERYHDLLKSGGRLVTVIDDSILGGPKYATVRDFIRERFIVRAVVSLPGDAFQRSTARVKTSLIVLEKRDKAGGDQPPVFMYYCKSVGIDDSPRQRVLPVDRRNREAAAKEIGEVTASYRAFLAGDKSAKEWTVPASAIADRMDVKSALPQPGRNV
ncbi:MAG: type restriction enzyme protein, partial [Gaiellales bacterium]|nr:type restriction enzyme protein [Gaiellales bacterium]